MNMLGIASKIFLFPYFAILKFRHFLYDRGIKKSKSYPVPVICIGNITVGGTGKTPHAEMLIRLLGERYNVALLSRGYKRKSKGFRIVGADDNYKMCGDEPLQIKQKFPEATVAVCKDRCEGIERLLAMEKKPDIIILDDGFQHRKVKPSHSVVLVNYNRPLKGDNLLPIGRLRDLPEQIRRADSVIITKSPVAVGVDGVIDHIRTEEEVKMEEPRWRSSLKLSENQKLYFSSILYGKALPLFTEEAEMRYIYSENAIFFTGIANDSEFRNNLSAGYRIMGSLKFADHKNFSRSDIKEINRWAEKSPTAAIFTTEKDSKRLSECKGLSKSVRSRLFYIPIEVAILPESAQTQFLESLL